MLLFIVPLLLVAAHSRVPGDTTLTRRIQLGATLGVVPDSLRSRGFH